MVADNIIYILYVCYHSNPWRLTCEEVHHGRHVEGGWGQAQHLLPAGYGGIVDGLDVDVMALQQEVTHL